MQSSDPSDCLSSLSFKLHSLYPLLLNVYTAVLSITHSSLLSTSIQPSFKLSRINCLPLLNSSKSLFSSLSVFQSSALSFTANMTSPPFSGGRRNVKRFSLTGIVDFSRNRELGEKFRISCINVEEFLRWGGGADTAS